MATLKFIKGKITNLPEFSPSSELDTSMCPSPGLVTGRQANETEISTQYRQYWLNY